ncbi:hypothetical protein [uncultured Cetobacterium sp.]|uniref:hypothetical protein n=1 Tax=uncultured Cetobacterium sp. TaxID=527638 RepID=UPI002630A859|nr:hypothetical protein [uncultured Cetobacterium sp.]
MIYYVFVKLVLDSKKIKNKIEIKHKKINLIDRDIRDLNILYKETKLSSDKREKNNKNLKEINKEKKFNSTGEFINFIEKLCKRLQLNLLLVDREKNINEKNNDKKIYLEIYGKEKRILIFLKSIEKSEMFLTLKKSNFLLKKTKNTMVLKVEVMYIINNKKEKVKALKRKEIYFKKTKERNIFNLREGF